MSSSDLPLNSDQPAPAMTHLQISTETSADRDPQPSAALRLAKLIPPHTKILGCVRDALQPLHAPSTRRDVGHRQVPMAEQNLEAALLLALIPRLIRPKLFDQLRLFRIARRRHS